MLDPLSPRQLEMCRGHFFTMRWCMLYMIIVPSSFFFKFTIWQKKNPIFFSLSLFQVFLNVHVNYFRRWWFLQKRAGQPTRRRKQIFFVWKRNKEKKTTKTFATICALYVYVCTEVFLFTVKMTLYYNGRDLFCIVIIKKKKSFIASAKNNQTCFVSLHLNSFLLCKLLLRPGGWLANLDQYFYFF